MSRCRCWARAASYGRRISGMTTGLYRFSTEQARPGRTPLFLGVFPLTQIFESRISGWTAGSDLYRFSTRPTVSLSRSLIRTGAFLAPDIRVESTRDSWTSHRRQVQQSRVEVRPKVFYVLDSDTQSQQRGRQMLLTGNARSAFDRGLYGTQTRGVLNEPDARAHVVSGLGAAMNIE